MDDIRIPSDFSTSVVNTGKWWYELIHIYIVIPSLLVCIFTYGPTTLLRLGAISTLHSVRNTAKKIKYNQAKKPEKE